MGYKMRELRVKNTLYDRVNKLLVSQEWSDCCFSVSDKIFKAHKLILGMSSPVFEAMFYGPLSTNEVITITDIEPNIFQLLLNYIYTDKVQIHSTEEAYELLYVSKKYMFEDLTEICVEYIKSDLSIDNVVSVLNYPDYIQNKQLVSTALELLCQHADYILMEQKNHIDYTCMQKILNCNTINMLEKDLIKYVFEWTSFYCEQNDIEKSFENRREVLTKNGLMKLLKFFTLSPKDLEEITDSKDNLLLTDEVENFKKAILCTSNANRNVNSNIEVLRRKSIRFQWHYCYRTPIRSVSPLIIDQTNNTITTKIKANKSMFIKNLSIISRRRMYSVFDRYDSHNTYNEKFSVSVTCEKEKNDIKKIDYQNNVNYEAQVNVQFDEPILIKKESWYKITFAWPLHCPFYPLTYSVQNRNPYFTDDKIKVEFDDCTNAFDNRGSFLIGLQFCM